jgi:hypothetical protein
LGLILIALFLAFGQPVALLAAGGSEDLAGMGLTYLRITVFAAPLIFVLSVNSDALRNEGLVMFMAAMSLLVSLSNMGFNYVLIGLLDMGVAGSAYGTAMAQALALAIILAFRVFGDTGLRPSALWHHSPVSGWGRILALGAPQSLNFIGLALGSGAIIAALQWVEAPDYDATVSAYGIVTRLITFAFLPLLGLAHAMQTITGNNYGAGPSGAAMRACGRGPRGLRLLPRAADRHDRLRRPDRIGLRVGPGRHREVARILPVISAGFFAAGPLMMIAMHFQAIGDAGRAAILGLSKPYLFAMPLTFALAGTVGEPGIWLAAPVGGGPAARADGDRPGSGRERAVPAMGSCSPRSEGRCGHDTRLADDPPRPSRRRSACAPTLAEQGAAISHAQALETGRAARHGFRDWNAFHARDRATGPPARLDGRRAGDGPLPVAALRGDGALRRTAAAGLVPAGARPRRGRRRGALRQFLEPAQADPGRGRSGGALEGAHVGRGALGHARPFSRTSGRRDHPRQFLNLDAESWAAWSLTVRRRSRSCRHPAQRAAHACPCLHLPPTQRVS